MSNNHSPFDVVIVGGGIAGLSMACLLGQVQGMRVACLDQEAVNKVTPSDARTTAISYGSSLVLERAGVWDDLERQGCAIAEIDVLDGDSPVLLNFLERGIEDAPFGWVVPNLTIKRVLREKIKTLKSVTYMAPSRVNDFEVMDDCVRLALEDGSFLRGALVIGADGRQSAVRGFMDVSVRRWDYRQRAIVCFIAHEKPHYNKAVEHFQAQGPIAILPIPARDGAVYCSSVVLTEHEGRGGSLMDLSAEDFLRAVAAKIPRSYGAIRIIGERFAYPLSLSHAASYIAPRMALVADAAHGIHPIAGQGLNLGFRDLDVLSRLIEGAQAQGEDLGKMEMLLSYQRKRRPDNTAMIAAMDLLVRVFSTDFAPVKVLRRQGLKFIARQGRLKGAITRWAKGA